MSVVAALVTGEEALMASDTLVFFGEEEVIDSYVKKCWMVRPNVLVGAVGDLADLQKVFHEWVPGDYTDDPTIEDSFEKWIYNELKNGLTELMGSATLIIACPTLIAVVDPDGSITVLADEYGAIGSGGREARSALSVMARYSRSEEKKLEEAINISNKYVHSCGGDVLIVRTV